MTKTYDNFLQNVHHYRAVTLEFKPHAHKKTKNNSFSLKQPDERMLPPGDLQAYELPLKSHLKEKYFVLGRVQRWLWLHLAHRED